MMKKSILILLISFFLIIEANAQCKSPYYNLKEGTIIVMESFDNKDKLQSRQETKVLKYDETADGFDATIGYKVTDKKGKIASEGDYKMSCSQDVFKIDMSNFVPSESMSGFENMEVDVQMDQLEYPSSLSVGSNLKDASIIITTKNNPIPMKMEFNITDRKVEGKEMVTTPAGTFDCFKISYNTRLKMLINMNFKNVEYLSENSGAVRTETYKSNGNLVGYSVITQYEL
jgi:hypothetical protein